MPKEGNYKKLFNNLQGAFRQNSFTHSAPSLTKNLGATKLANTAEPNNKGKCDSGNTLPIPIRNNKNKTAKHSRFNKKATVVLGMLMGF